jgi:hypothetical protein
MNTRTLQSYPVTFAAQVPLAYLQSRRMMQKVRMAFASSEAYTIPLGEKES